MPDANGNIITLCNPGRSPLCRVYRVRDVTPPPRPCVVAGGHVLGEWRHTTQVVLLSMHPSQALARRVRQRVLQKGGPLHRLAKFYTSRQYYRKWKQSPAWDDQTLVSCGMRQPLAFLGIDKGDETAQQRAPETDPSQRQSMWAPIKKALISATFLGPFQNTLSLYSTFSWAFCLKKLNLIIKNSTAYINDCSCLSLLYPGKTIGRLRPPSFMHACHQTFHNRPQPIRYLPY
ncbi:hypothetical protein J6590_043791 [Homalodisca vitripennis]|nr:hypothetical protein J6590_043791 [Homalodisca vitripennis]